MDRWITATERPLSLAETQTSFIVERECWEAVAATIPASIRLSSLHRTELTYDSMRLGISFWPFPQDLDEWVAAGATGWSWAEMVPYARRLQCRIQPVFQKDRNALAGAFVEATQSALGLREIKDFAGWMKRGDARAWSEGVGWLSIAYTEDGKRQSASVAYLHDCMDKRPNLNIWFESFVRRIHFDSSRRATGVEVELASGERLNVKAAREVCLCAGAIDSPRLLLLSGIGPRKQLEDLGIPVLCDLPVGENLLDHPETSEQLPFGSVRRKLIPMRR